MKTEVSFKVSCDKVIIRKCHICGHLSESIREIQRCTNCNKSFLPMNYFGKVHAKNSRDFDNLFATSDELHEEDMLKGLQVLW